MSEDHRDGHDTGKKTNASPEHIPKNAVRGDVAPSGSVGRPPARPAQPGLGTPSGGRVLDQGASQPVEKGPDPAQDDRPIAIESGNAAIDALSEADGQQVKSMEEIKALAAARSQEPQKTPEPSSGPFPETDDPEVNAHYAQNGEMISEDSPDHPDNAGDTAQSKPEGPRISQSDYAKAFRQAHGQSQAMQRSKGIDPD